MRGATIQFDLESELTLDDFAQAAIEQSVAHRRPIRTALGLIGTAASIWAVRIGWIQVLVVLGAIPLFLPSDFKIHLFYRLLTLWCGNSIGQIRLLIDDEKIVYETNTTDQVTAHHETILWTELVESGKAIEGTRIFLLESETRRWLGPKHAVLIPKRAFESEQALDDFRMLVNEKMHSQM